MANELVIRNGLVSKGDITFPITVKEAGSSYTLTNDDYSIVVDVNENFTITIPSSATTLTGNIFTFKNLSNSNNLILTTEDSQVEIDNSLSDYTIGPLQSVQIQATGSEWVVNGQSGTSGSSGSSGTSGSSGSSGTSGSSGSSGTSGSSGSSGTSGISVGGCFNYNIAYNNGTTPSSGEVSVNSGLIPTVSIIKIHKTDDDSNDNSVQLNALVNNGGSLQVNFSNGAIAWYNVTSGSLSGDVYTFNVVIATATASNVSIGNGEICVLGGASGTSGTSGSSGSSGTSGSSGSSGTSGSSGSSGTSGVGGSEGCLSQTLNSTQNANPTAYNLSFDSATFNGTQGLKFNYSAKVTGLSVPSSFRNLNNSYTGTQGYVILTEKGGTKYVTYTYSNFSNSTTYGHYDLKVIHVNSSGTPSIGDEYCITLIELI